MSVQQSLVFAMRIIVLVLTAIAFLAAAATGAISAEPRLAPIAAAQEAEVTSAAKQTANTLLRHLARDQMSQAYALYIEEIEEQMGLEQFAKTWLPLQRLGIWTARWTSAVVGRSDAEPDALEIDLKGVLRTIAGSEVALEATVLRRNSGYRMICLRFSEK